MVLRFRRFRKAAGSGIYVIVPFVDYATICIDMLMMTTRFGAEETLATDLVPVDVDAVLFWHCRDPKKAATEAADYRGAVL